jgi:TP901-1 family phage major tail protein
MGKYISGTDVMVFIKNGSTYTSIAYATNHTLTVGSNSSEISTKDDAKGVWNASVVQKLNWSCTTENMYSLDGAGAGFDDLFTAMSNRTVVDLKFGLENTSQTTKGDAPWSPISSPIFTGTAYVTDLSWNNPDGDNSTFSATFTGTGELVLS